MSKLVVGLVVLALLTFGADRVTANLVSRQVERGLSSAQRLSTPPSVTFPEVPFLPQAFRGRYTRVDVGMSDVPTAGALVVDHLATSLYGARVGLADVVRGDLTRLPVDRGEAEGFVSFPHLRAAARTLLAGRGVDVNLSAGTSSDRVAFTASGRTVLGTFTVGGEAQLSVENGLVRVQLLPSTLTGIPASLRSQVAAQLDLSGLVPELPYGFRATTVAVEPEGLRLHAAGNGLIIPI